jgi:hypothetical protein
LIYVPIAPSNTFSFTAAESYTPTPGSSNIGLAGRGRGGPAAPLATPAPYGPVRRGAEGNPIRGGILTAWTPATQKEVWCGMGGGQTGGGALSTAANLVVQTTPNGHLLAYTADKGERLLDITLPNTSGVGPPMTYQLDGKQYIAVLAGTLVGGGRGGRGGAPRGGQPAANQEPTAAAAAAAQNRGNAPAPIPPAPGAGAPLQAPAPPSNPKLFVYTLTN